MHLNKIKSRKASYYKGTCLPEETKVEGLHSRIIWRKVTGTIYAAAAAKLLQSCPTLCDPIDGSPPGSPVLRILQARILEWVTISFSNACMHAKSLQLCPTLCNPMDSRAPGSSVHGIL